MTSVDLPHQGRDSVDAEARDDLRELFELEQVHRRGPAAFVYRARDLEYNHLVALKVMPRAGAAGPDAEEAFHRAAGLVAALDHPHIVPLYSAGATDRFFWCSMQYVEGRSLADALRSSVPMEPAVCLRIVGQLASALDSAHRLGVVHAALTPANVLLDAAGDVHVTDFWIPWVLERLGALPEGGGKALRVKYRAPEQLVEGRCDPQADQHALATLMQACLMKTPARVPPDMARAIERAMSPTPEARFPSVREFATALGVSLARTPSGVHTLLLDDDEEDDPRAAPPSRLRWVAASVLTLVALGAIAAPWLRSRGSTYFPSPAETESRAASDSLVFGPRVSDPPPAPAPATTPARAVPRPSARAPVRKAPPAPRATAVSPGALPGRLFINATPWGQVYVDGELLGNTPRVDVPISPGAHRLRVVRDGFEPYELAIRVQPGQDLRITDIVLQESKP